MTSNNFDRSRIIFLNKDLYDQHIFLKKIYPDCLIPSPSSKLCKQISYTKAGGSYYAAIYTKQFKVFRKVKELRNFMLPSTKIKIDNKCKKAIEYLFYSYMPKEIYHFLGLSPRSNAQPDTGYLLLVIYNYIQNPRQYADDFKFKAKNTSKYRIPRNTNDPGIIGAQNKYLSLNFKNITKEIKNYARYLVEDSHFISNLCKKICSIEEIVENNYHTMIEEQVKNNDNTVIIKSLYHSEFELKFFEDEMKALTMLDKFAKEEDLIRKRFSGVIGSFAKLKEEIKGKSFRNFIKLYTDLDNVYKMLEATLKVEMNKLE